MQWLILCIEKGGIEMPKITIEVSKNDMREMEKKANQILLLLGEDPATYWYEKHYALVLQHLELLLPTTQQKGEAE